MEQVTEEQTVWLHRYRLVYRDGSPGEVEVFTPWVTDKEVAIRILRDKIFSGGQLLKPETSPQTRLAVMYMGRYSLLEETFVSPTTMEDMIAITDMESKLACAKRKIYNSR